MAAAKAEVVRKSVGPKGLCRFECGRPHQELLSIYFELQKKRKRCFEKLNRGWPIEMSGYARTHIPIPEDDADFEEKCVILFREVLGDPNVHRLGRSGQAQSGVDLVGNRNSDPKKVVGIQCKLRAPGHLLKAKEVRDEVRMAVKFTPHLTEYIIATTAPNDVKLSRLALTLSNQRRAKGRKLTVRVWGWGVLTARINQYETAKNAFDPGFSPSVAAQTATLNKLVQGQTKQATTEDMQAGFADLKNLIGQSGNQVDVFPAVHAESEVKKELRRIAQRRGFSEVDTPAEFASLARRVSDGGDLVRATAETRADVLERTARSHTHADTLAVAREFHKRALALNPLIDASLYAAILPDAEGRSDESLIALKALNTPDALNVIFIILLRKEADGALAWFDNSGVKFTDFPLVGNLNILIKRMEAGQYDAAIKEVEMLSDAQLSECPALYSVRANLRLASIVPNDQRSSFIGGMAVNPRVIQFASDNKSQGQLKAARGDFESLYARINDLNLPKLKPFLEELILWLQLEDDATRETARKTIGEEIKDPAKTLRRVRLALAYNIPFNREALSRHLLAQKEIGNWTDDEWFASFLLAYHDQDSAALVGYFKRYRDELYKSPFLVGAMLAGIEVEALTRSNRYEDARKRIAEHLSVQRIDQDMADQLHELVASVEHGDEIERLRKLYEAKGELVHLRILVGALISKKNYRELAHYAPVLVRSTKQVEDLQLALRALYTEKKYDAVVALCEELPELFQLSDDFASLKGWALFQIGRVLPARDIARNLFEKRGDSSDRELAVNTAIESGDWGYLQQIVAREIPKIATLDSRSLIRLARLAQESGSTYVDQFRDAAIERAPDTPEVYLSAYQLNVDRGTEYQDSRTHEWFQKAVALSGPTGPVERVGIKDIVARAPAWNKRVDNVHDMLKNGQIPAFMAARALNRQPIEYILGTAIRNAKQADRKMTYPILAFSGQRNSIDLSGARVAAFDLTTLFSLQYLGLLQEAFDAFDRVIISPSTLSSLFLDRQFLRFRQPSELAKAQYLMQLIASGSLKLLANEPGPPHGILPDIDPELQNLLNLARNAGAKVVRTAPVFKIRSFLEEQVSMDSYNDVLTDTHQVLKLLSNKIDAETASNAELYLKQVDNGWEKTAAIDASSILYLDQLSVTYLHHVGLLEKLTNNVAAVWVSADVAERCEEVIRGSELSAELLDAVEKIRATLNSMIEKGSRIGFSNRRLVEGRVDEEGDGEENDPAISFPSIDIMSDLREVDVIFCDDRMLNKDAFWTDGSRRVATASTLDLLNALNARGKTSENQKYRALHRLREGGFFAVPVDQTEVLRELNRASVENGNLLETPELFAIRESIAIGLRSQMYLPTEIPWIDRLRLTIFHCLRSIWSEAEYSEDIPARADWLLAIMPDPTAWCLDVVDEAQWALALQKLSGQLGILFAAPVSTLERQQKYGEWVEDRLAKPIRTHQHWLWSRAVRAFIAFFTQIVQPGNAPVRLNRLLVQMVLDTLHPVLLRELLEDDDATKLLGLALKQTLTLHGIQSFDLTSFNAAVRDALNGEKKAKITLSDGKSIDAKLEKKARGVVKVTCEGQEYSMADAGLLSDNRSTRRASLKAVFDRSPLTKSEQKKWSVRVDRGLSDSDYADLAQIQRNTPEAFSQFISAPKSLGSENMVPSDSRYFDRLVGPVGSDSFNEYVSGPLKENGIHLLRAGKAGLKRIAKSAISQPLIPFDLLQETPIDDIAELLSASDPFSLVFGFEVCAHKHAAGDKKASALGTKFLERLFNDRKFLEERCQIFAACAVVTATRLREVLESDNAPAYWVRLATFAHAGVLASALHQMAEPKKFMSWAFSQFGSKFTWQGIIDKREAPRWESEFVSPDSLINELVGRCFGATHGLSKTKRPKAWLAIVDREFGKLKPANLAFFPGPLDDFTFPKPTPAQLEVFKNVKRILRRKKSFKDTRGLGLIAYSGGIDASLSPEVLKLLERSDQYLNSLATAELPLKCCSYVAGLARDHDLSRAVVNRCLGLISLESSPEEILRLLLLAFSACAAYADAKQYYKEIGLVAARFAYASPPSAAVEIHDALKIVIYRDFKMNSALKQAITTLEAAMLPK